MVDETIERLVRIEEKVDTLLDARKDQETRLRSLERWRAGVVGAGAVLSAVFALALRHLHITSN